jgi:hypothetical protein
MPRSLTYDIAIQLLRRSDCVLAKTFVATKRSGVEFSIISTNGGPSGPVTEATAARLLADPRCHPCDPGLFADVAQSFAFHRNSNRTETRHPGGLKPTKVAGSPIVKET